VNSTFVQPGASSREPPCERHNTESSDQLARHTSPGTGQIQSQDRTILFTTPRAGSVIALVSDLLKWFSTNSWVLLEQHYERSCSELCLSHTLFCQGRNRLWLTAFEARFQATLDSKRSRFFLMLQNEHSADFDAVFPPCQSKRIILLTSDKQAFGPFTYY
jgi:hypothetical protein